MRTRERHLFFASKDNRTVILTRQDFLPDRTADGDLLFTFLNFQRNLSSYSKFGSRTKTYRDFVASRAASRPKKARSASFKNNFSNVKLVSEVNSSNICSRSSLKRSRDIFQTAISTRWIIAKVSQKLYYEFIALVFLNMLHLFVWFCQP